MKEKMKRKTKIAAVIGTVVVGAIVIVVVWCKKLPNVGTNPNVAPDGIPYGVEVDGILYQPEFYDEDYGHFEDLVAEDFEENKPDYLEEITFQGVQFPAIVEDAKYFPAFIAFDVVKYVPLPEDVMTKYFPKEEKEEILDYIRNGIEVDGEIYPFEYEEAPVYQKITVIPVVMDKKYKVLYETDKGIYVKIFEIDENGKFHVIDGGW